MLKSDHKLKTRGRRKATTVLGKVRRVKMPQRNENTVYLVNDRPAQNGKGAQGRQINRGQKKDKT